MWTKTGTSQNEENSNCAIANGANGKSVKEIAQITGLRCSERQADFIALTCVVTKSGCVFKIQYSIFDPISSTSHKTQRTSPVDAAE